MSKVGRFELDFDGPYPCRINLSCGRDEISFTHDELSDLKYAVDKAIRECKSRLPENKWHEIE